VSAAEAELMRLSASASARVARRWALLWLAWKKADDESEQALAMAFSSVLYAAYLGIPRARRSLAATWRFGTIWAFRAVPRRRPGGTG
jgi:hypothetical protein